MKSGYIGFAAAVLAVAAAQPVHAQPVHTPADTAKIETGIQAYNNYCFTCHGENLVSSGQVFDLRRLKPDDRDRFQKAVLNGKGQMPPWKGVVEDEQIEAIWAYVMSQRK